MHVLVTAASKHGATDDVAQLIAGALRDAGLTVDVVSPADVTSVEGYDAIVVGSGVYAGQWLEPARSLLEEHAGALRSKAVWLFSSGPVGEPPKPEGDPAEAADLVKLVGAREHRVFPGRLDRGRLGLGEKLITRVVGAPEGDYRVPADITEWGRHIARSLEEPVTTA